MAIPPVLFLVQRFVIISLFKNFPGFRKKAGILGNSITEMVDACRQRPVGERQALSVHNYLDFVL